MISMIIQKKTTVIIPHPQEKDILCRSCGTLAMCNKFVCYKKKQGKKDCNSCKERLCQHHWRVFFNRNIKV